MCLSIYTKYIYSQSLRVRFCNGHCDAAWIKGPVTPRGVTSIQAHKNAVLTVYKTIITRLNLSIFHTITKPKKANPCRYIPHHTQPFLSPKGIFVLKYDTIGI